MSVTLSQIQETTFWLKLHVLRRMAALDFNMDEKRRGRPVRFRSISQNVSVHCCYAETSGHFSEFS
jgi:hypothetical protein